ncbi:hypothetical protein Nepgr_015777 [Nepenthes gracilis]|uniref:Uncharacterized protein n=1 Tax=Nepenthes gracilis TaxID=150966 RepID=A0AAD3XRL6_NEPGR|nr:hypothetical protein Nepgr_015777 [Nepenthes gracilis]
MWNKIQKRGGYQPINIEKDKPNPNLGESHKKKPSSNSKSYKTAIILSEFRFFPGRSLLQNLAFAELPTAVVRPFASTGESTGSCVVVVLALSFCWWW